MLIDAINKLNAEQRRELADLGVPSSRVSEWIHARRIPTRTQAVALHAVTGIALSKIEQELTEMEIDREEQKRPGLKAALERVADWRKRLLSYHISAMRSARACAPGRQLA